MARSELGSSSSASSSRRRFASCPQCKAFIEKYPRSVPGIPTWANWQHFFNLFLMTFRLVSTPLSIQAARSLRFLIMVWFLVFIWAQVKIVPRI